MIALTLAEIAQATDGKLLHCADAQQIISQVSTDTRNIPQDALFIALKGQHFDAHQFLEKSLEAGASALLVEKKTTLAIATILVKDTRIALGHLSAYLRCKMNTLKMVAITGSNGKTTTKGMLKSILDKHCGMENSVLATAGNFNNEIGVPLTLLRLNQQHRFAVLELGANHIGEIAYTAALVKADVALVNNVMPAHLEGFGSIEGVARAKSEIWSSLGVDGVAVVNLDNSFTKDYLTALQKTEQPILTFSQQDKQADLFASDIIFDQYACATFTLHYRNQEAGSQQATISLNIAGGHNVSNALAAAAISCALGCSLSTIQAGLIALNSVAGRVNSVQLSDKVRLIDDSYNANSASIKAAIDILLKSSGQSVLILGDMAELGSESEAQHKMVGEYAAQQGITLLLTVGTLSKQIQSQFQQSKNEQQNAVHFADQQTLNAYLSEYLQTLVVPHTFLVKGSRGAAMEVVVEFIQSVNLLKN